jgi:hypothetical protein
MKESLYDDDEFMVSLEWSHQSSSNHRFCPVRGGIGFSVV